MMTIREFFAALPKVDLNLQLTGAFRKESLLMIANQNAIPAASEDFEQWLALLDAPEYERLDEIARAAGSWLMYPEDFALAVYDIGVALSKQNVRYAEIALAPSDFIGSANMNFETLLDALNDGRDRALRGWGVDMAWLLCIPRDKPRAGDDVARWATGARGRAGNVVALGLTGQEDAQPIGQFHRAFATAQKKALPTSILYAGSGLGRAGVRAALEALQPDRLADPWGIAEDETLLSQLQEAGIPLLLSLQRALRLGLIKQARDFPLKRLRDSGVQVLLASGMPALYQSSLVDDYVLAHEACGLSVDDLVSMARRAIELAYLDEERKDALLREFDFEAAAARSKLGQ